MPRDRNGAAMVAIDALFWSNVACHLVLLGGAVWSVACPSRRVYPMSAKGMFYYAMWAMFWLSST